MNEFVLFTIQNYSYQIDRETAKNLKMSSEVRNEKILKKLLMKIKFI